MKTLWIAIPAFALLLTSCDPARHKTTEKQPAEDSLTNAIEARKEVDDIMNNVSDELLEEAKQPGPVEIADISVQQDDGDKILSFSVKNISDKTIEGIRFLWHGENAFGEAADMNGGFDKTIGGGETDRTMKPGNIITCHFNLERSNVKKNIIIWAKQVAFTDGSGWKPKHKRSTE